jgi:signal peptidase I
VPTAAVKNTPREVIECVVFVVVLVLLLKTFVAEAFVIPTGSMATTLWGDQKWATCPECGYGFPVNCSSEREVQPGVPRDPVVGAICPNCRFRIEFGAEGRGPSCNTGDRVLVAKFLGDGVFQEPARQDVVVFKYPQAPQRNNEALNYIKRLIGKPGETIALYYGDVYVYPPPYDSAAAPLNYPGRPRPERSEDLWQLENTYRDDPQAIDLFRQGKFAIVRKSPRKMLALKRLVHDNDYLARDLTAANFPPRWAPEKEDASQNNGQADWLALRRQGDEERAWVADGPNGFQHLARPGRVTWLRYRNLLFDRSRSVGASDKVSAIVKPELITDFLGYDSWQPKWGAHPLPALNWVGDLLLEFDVTVGQGPGDLVLELSRGVDRFQARWDLASGKCTLVRQTGDHHQELATQDTAVRAGGSYHLRFANVDERLVVWVNNQLPFGEGVNYPPPRERGPTVNDLQPASIGASGAEIHIRALKLWRDTYYTVEAGASDARLNPDDWSDPDKWAPLRDLSPLTLYVQPGHYLCLGDNSPESSDGRSWGLVPRRLMLGRALLVYFPPWRMGRIE